MFTGQNKIFDTPSVISTFFLIKMIYRILTKSTKINRRFKAMKQLSLLILLIGITASAAFCQKVTLEGYVFEELNRGYLNEVKVTVLEKSGVYVGETLSDIDGHFKFDVQAGKEYTLQYEKKIFQRVSEDVSTVGKKADEKIFLKKQLERQPGYLLEVTLADKRFNEAVNVDAINGARIEIFNITANREELVIDSAKSPVFSQTLLQGYHYAIMIRKKNYFTRRMDAHVNIDGCYLCMEGFGTVTPGMVSNVTSARDNKIGTLLANVDLSKIDTNKNIVFQNIYYAYNSSELTDEARKELDKVTSLLQNNGALVVELGSHTDSRGSAESNQRLSQARAESAVNYILSSGLIDKSRLKAKGYGEAFLTNNCEDGTPCNEAEHIRNRRTELKIIGFTLDPNEGRSLAEIVHAEEMIKFIKAGESQKEYKAGEASTSATPTNLAVIQETKVVVATPEVVKSAPTPVIKETMVTPAVVKLTPTKTPINNETAVAPAVIKPNPTPTQQQKAVKPAPSVAVVQTPKVEQFDVPTPKAEAKNSQVAVRAPEGEPKTKVTPSTPARSKPPAMTMKQLEGGEPMASTPITPQSSMPMPTEAPRTAASTMQQLENPDNRTAKQQTSQVAKSTMPQLENTDSRIPKPQTPEPVFRATTITAKVVEATPTAVKAAPVMVSSTTPTPAVTVTPTPVMVAPTTPTPAVSNPKENVKINISPVAVTFSGYKVEVFTSSTPLPTDSEEIKNLSVILSEIGVDKLKNGQYSYMVGSFLNWSETERFLEKTQNLYGKARIVEYFNGKRITQ
jgi:outer membrane protein OmpA-like peptidoglycan-associated protein